MTATVRRSTDPRERGRTDRLARSSAGLVGLMFVVFGMWAFVAPGSFFDVLATFEPRNDHFLRDIGAFQIGLGAVLLGALVWRDALVVALLGVGLGSAFHAVGHVIDRDLGGTPSTDIPTFTVIALVLLGAGIARLRSAERP